MKLEFNRKHTTIAIYSLLVIAGSILFYKFVHDFNGFKTFMSSIVNLLTPFIYGAITAYIMNPVLNWLEEKAFPWLFKDKVSRKARRRIGVLLSIFFGFAVVSLFLAILIPQILDSINSLAQGINSFAPKVQVFLNELMRHYSNNVLVVQALDMLVNSAETIGSSAQKLIQQSYSFISTALPNIFGGVVKITSSLLDIVVGLIISIYLLLSKETFYAQVKKVCFAFFPNRLVDAAIVLAHDSNNIFCGFISGKLVDSAIIGVLCFIGTSLLDMPYAVLVSVIVGVTNIIPYFGPFIGAIPSIFIILIANPIKALYFAVFVLILQQLDGNVIGPKILGDSTGLSGFWVIFAVTFFGGLWGFVGMLIGVPLFAVIYSLIRNFAEYRLKVKGLALETSAYAAEGQALMDTANRPYSKTQKEKTTSEDDKTNL